MKAGAIRHYLCTLVNGVDVKITISIHRFLCQIYAEMAARDGIILPVLGPLNPGEGGTETGHEEAGQESSKGDKAISDVVTSTAAHADAAVTGVKATSRADADGSVSKAVVADLGFASLTGDYRRVVVRPQGFEWKLMRYRCVAILLSGRLFNVVGRMVVPVCSAVQGRRQSSRSLVKCPPRIHAVTPTMTPWSKRTSRYFWSPSPHQRRSQRVQELAPPLALLSLPSIMIQLGQQPQYQSAMLRGLSPP